MHSEGAQIENNGENRFSITDNDQKQRMKTAENENQANLKETNENSSPNQILFNESVQKLEISAYETISISSKRFQDNEQGMDSEHAWVIDIACFFVQFFVIGNIFSFGVFLPVYIDAFNPNQANVSWIGSIGSCLNVFLGILVGGLDDRYGNEKVILVGSILIGIGFLLASFSTALWQLYLTHGLICGVGFSACFVSSTGAVGQWFKKNRGLAIGVAVSGAGLGQFVMSQVNGTLILSVGWRSTLRYLALINVTGLLLCARVIHRRLPCGHHLLNWHNQQEFCQQGSFFILCTGYLLMVFGLLIPNTYLLIYCEQPKYHLSFTTSVFILSMNGIANGLGRVVMGEIADISCGRLKMLTGTTLFGGVLCFLWLFCQDFSSLLAFALGYGFFGGAAISLAPSFVADLVGVKKISSAMGMMYTVSSVANLFSPPIAGWLSDYYGSYEAAILLSGSCQVLAAIFFAAMSLPSKENEEENSSNYHTEDDQQVQTKAKEVVGKENPDIAFAVGTKMTRSRRSFEEHEIHLDNSFAEP